MRQHLWRPPDGGTFKLNFEASFLKESRISYAAVLVRNNKRVFLRACTYPYGDVVDAFIAEARAYEMALIFVEEMGFCRILLEGDSLTTIKKLHSGGEDRSLLGPIINSIRVLERQFDKVPVSVYLKDSLIKYLTILCQG